MNINTDHYTRSSRSESNGLMSNNKVLITLAIVLACFSILFPKVFYPIFQGSIDKRSKTVYVNNDGNF